MRSFTEEDVQNIVRIVGALESSPFDHLEIELGELKLVLGKGDSLPAARTTGTASTAPVANSLATDPVPASSPAPMVASAPSVQPAPAANRPGLLDIVAPTIGKFYSRPEPGEPPFVSVGQTIEKGQTVALLEVMKLFNAVAAEHAGTVVEICVSEGDFVEHGQVLYRVQQS